MATQRTTQRTTHSGKGWLIRACSFFALVIAALVFLLGGLFSGTVQSILNLIGQICLVIGIGFPAYDYTRGKRVVWKVIYWIALIVYIFGCIFGCIKGI